MKANIPISNDGDFEELFKINNEYFYFGTILKEVWKNNFEHMLFNRRTYDICYFDKLKIIKEITEKLKLNNNTIRYAVNHSFPNKYKKYIKKELELLLENVEIDEIIIEDFDLIEIAEKFGKKVVITTRLGVLNKEEVKFIHKIVGKSLRGFILPRQLVPREINEINDYCYKKKLDLEYFFELGGCLMEERFCFFHEFLDYEKNVKKEVVKLPICLNLFINSYLQKKEIRKGFGSNNYFFTCRACKIYFFEKRENISLKIVGRCFNNKRNLKVYYFLKDVLKNLEEAKNFEEFKRKNSLTLKKHFGKICNFNICPYGSP